MVLSAIVSLAHAHGIVGEVDIAIVAWGEVCQFFFRMRAGGDRLLLCGLSCSRQRQVATGLQKTGDDECG